MKKLSMDKLISTVQARREALGLTKKDLSEKCGMNRTMISHMENHNYVPSIKQLQDLAEALEVSRQTIGSLENGRYNPSILLAFKIARYFGLTIEDIFIYEEDDGS